MVRGDRATIFIAQFARRTLDHQLAIAAGILMVGALFVLAICLVRSLFILPAPAVNQCKGIAAAWRLSKSSLDRLLALEAIVHLPYAIAIMVLARMNEPDYPLADRASIGAAQCIA